MQHAIFISYRRDGGSWSTRALRDGLGAEFGKQRVFMDVADIDLGADFTDRLAHEVGRCDVMLAVITPNWASMQDAKGGRRLDDPADYVRLELEMGLKRRIPVVPVLVDGARMPSEAELPDDLKGLAKRNAIEIRHSHFDTDIQRLIESLRQSISAGGVAVSLSRYKWPLAAAAGLLVLVLAFVVFRNDAVNTVADDGAVAVSGNLHVGGDLTIHQPLDPELMSMVQETVARLTDQLETKDDQIRVRDDQAQRLTAAVTALARQRARPGASNELETAMANLVEGETTQAKRVFREILERKSAEAQVAAKIAAQAARHLGALAGLDSEQEALGAYQRALELDPDNLEAKKQVAAIRQEPGQVRLQAVLTAGREPVESCFTLYHAAQDIDGNRQQVRRDCTTTARYTLDAGRYYVAVQSGNATAGTEYAVEPGGLVNEVMDLAAGQLRLQAVLTAGGEPVESCFTVYHAEQDIDGNRQQVRRDCTTTARYTLDAGRYYVAVQSGNATAGTEYVVEPGGLVNEVMDLAAGQLRLQAVLTAGGEPVESCFTVYHAEQDIDGNRQQVRRDCTTTARYTLDTGRYFIVARAGETMASEEYAVAPGGFVNERLLLQQQEL